MSQPPSNLPAIPPPPPARPGFVADLWKRHLDRRDVEHFTEQRLRVIHAEQHETPEGQQTLAMQHENEQLLEAMRQQGVISQAFYQALKEILVAAINHEQANLARRENHAHERSMADAKFTADKERQLREFEQEINILEIKYQYESSPAVQDQINEHIERLRGQIRLMRMAKDEARDDTEAELLYRFVQRIEDVTGRERRRA